MNSSLKELNSKEEEDHFPSLGKITKTKKINNDEDIETSKSKTSMNPFDYKRRSEPDFSYAMPWKRTKNTFDTFEREGYFYTGNVRPDLIYKSTNMLPRSYKDVRIDEKVKPFRITSRNPEKAKEKTYLTKIGKMALK